MRIETAADADPTPYTVKIDGQAPFTIRVRPHEPRYELARDLDPKTEHRVTVTREAEAFAGPHRFAGFEAAELLPRVPKKRRLLVVGDSISCGYGVLGDKPDCKFSFETERASEAFPSLVAEGWDADVVVACWSGKGVYRNYDGGTDEAMPELFDRILATDLAAGRAKNERFDAVVVSLGTNDFLGKSVFEPAPFERAYRDLVARLKPMAPRVVVTESAMIPPARRPELRAVLDRLGVPVVPVAFEGDRVGCDRHPDRAMHREIAASVLSTLR